MQARHPELRGAGHKLQEFENGAASKATSLLGRLLMALLLVAILLALFALIHSAAAAPLARGVASFEAVRVAATIVALLALCGAHRYCARGCSIRRLP